jgi:beta-phosphoglucomutase-like phosphatase (HAD superfamily)
MTTQKYIIFDFDGTLVDSVDLAVEIYNKIAPKYNCKPVQHEAREILSSKNPQKFFKTYGITPFKLFLLVYRIRRELGKHIPHIEPVKGMENALRSLRNHGYKLGILTSNSKANVEDFLDHKPFTRIVQFCVQRSEIVRKGYIHHSIIEKGKNP